MLGTRLFSPTTGIGRIRNNHGTWCANAFSAFEKPTRRCGLATEFGSPCLYALPQTLLFVKHHVGSEETIIGCIGVRPGV